MPEEYSRIKRPKYEKLILVILALGIALVVSVGYGLFLKLVEMWHRQPL